MSQPPKSRSYVAVSLPVAPLQNTKMSEEKRALVIAIPKPLKPFEDPRSFLVCVPYKNFKSLI